MKVALGIVKQVIFKYQFGIGEKKFYMAMDQHVQLDRTTPLRSAWSKALSAMTVECE